MNTSRQKILEYILEHQTTTVEELSKVFKVTPANIRHHLSILTQQGSIKVIGQKSDAGRGRRAQIYSSRQQSDQNNLDKLADAVLTILLQNSEAYDRDLMINQIALMMGMNEKTEFTNPTSRLYSAIRSLNRMSYQAHWEAHISNPRIILDHCPYRKIIDRHPELCQMDGSLLTSLLGYTVKQVEKLSNNAKGMPQCVFLLNQPT
jgi:predicted ArsR family transcriptional regulator